MKIRCPYCKNEYEVSKVKLFFRDKYQCTACSVVNDFTDYLSIFNLRRILNVVLIALGILWFGLRFFGDLPYMSGIRMTENGSFPFEVDYSVCNSYSWLVFIIIWFLAWYRWIVDYRIKKRSIEGFNQEETLFRDVSAIGVKGRAINTLVQAGIMEGKDDGYFLPDRPITKIDLLAALARLGGDDISAYADASEWGAACGIVRADDGSEETSSTVELYRAQAVTAIHKYIKYKGWDLPEVEHQPYTDISKLQEELQEAVKYCNSIGIIGDGKNNKFRSGVKMTRGEVAVVLARLWKKQQEAHSEQSVG